MNVLGCLARFYGFSKYGLLSKSFDKGWYGSLAELRGVEMCNFILIIQMVKKAFFFDRFERHG